MLRTLTFGTGRKKRGWEDSSFGRLPAAAGIPLSRLFFIEEAAHFLLLQ